jgi:hypothetical protein
MKTRRISTMGMHKVRNPLFLIIVRKNAYPCDLLVLRGILIQWVERLSCEIFLGATIHIPQFKFISKGESKEKIPKPIVNSKA